MNGTTCDCGGKKGFYSRMCQRCLPPRGGTVLEIIERGYIPVPESGCWIWMGGIHRKGGYGFLTVWLDGKRAKRMAHKVLYELLNGPVPEGLELDHLCRVPCCINPKHLEPVTHRENLRRAGILDKISKSKLANTHCPSGHPYSGDNVVFYPSSRGRHCRICGSWAWRKARQQGLAFA